MVVQVCSAVYYVRKHKVAQEEFQLFGIEDKQQGRP